MILKAIKYFSNQNLLKYINELEKPGFQTYISQGHYIQSDSGKNKAFITNFGAIGIGEYNDIRFLEPVSTMKFANSKGVIKTAVYGTVYQSCFKIGSEQKCFVYNGSTPHRINYLGKLNGSYSLKDILTYKEKAKNSNCALKVLNNGNLILYNGTTILWQSNTGGKGVGPYELELTEDKRFILVDSTGEIVYQSREYKPWKLFQHVMVEGYHGITDDSEIKVNWGINLGINNLIENYRLPGY